MKKSIPELAQFGPSIRVPELRDVRLTRRVRAVIDHNDFQRLRLVRQLGPTHLVYPGATHTRLEHSIGVFGTAQRFLVSLLRHPGFAESTGETDLLACLGAALCHDIGHYPFAHSLEALHRRGRDTPRHEDLAGQVLMGSLGQVFETLWGVPRERVARLITKKSHEHKSQIDRVLATVISSAIDADKMDYLERDSVHMGVPYGRSFDSQRLIQALTLNEAEDAIAITAKGKISAESFIFSRYMMFSEAYWHHAVRSASAMMEAALMDYVSVVQPEHDDLVTMLLTHSDDELLKAIYHQFGTADSSGAEPDRPCTRLILGMYPGTHRRLHKRIATYSRAYAEPEKQAAYERLYQMDGAAIDSLVVRLGEALSRMTGDVVFAGDVLIDTPPRDKDHPETVDVRFEGVRGRTSYRLHEHSRIVAGVHQDFVQVVKKIRVFVCERLAHKVREQQFAVEDMLLRVILE